MSDLSWNQAKDKIVIGLIGVIATCAVWLTSSIWSLNEKLAVIVTTIGYHDKEIENLKAWKDSQAYNAFQKEK